MADWYEREPHEIRRSFELENGNIVDIERVFANGFWQIRYRRGATPPGLQGQYTTFSAAERALHRHFASLVRPHRIIREVTEVAA